MSQTRYYRNRVLADSGFPLDDVSEHLEDPNAVVWVDLVAPSRDELNLLADELDLHALAVEDAINLNQRPKLDHYSDHDFLSAYAASFDPKIGQVTASETAVFITTRALITIRRDDTFPIAAVVERWDASPELAKHGVGFLIYGLLDVLVDGYFRSVQALDEEIEDVAAQLAVHRVQEERLDISGSPPTRGRLGDHLCGVTTWQNSPRCSLTLSPSASAPNCDPLLRLQTRQLALTAERRNGRPVVGEYGSMILVSFGTNGVASKGSTDQVQRQARHAADILVSENFRPDAVFCPPRTKSLPIVNYFLGELRALPRVVRTDRILDVPRAWFPSPRKPGPWPYHQDEADDAAPSRPTQAEITSKARAAMADLYTRQIIRFLLERQTVLIIASAESLNGLRSALGANDGPLLEQEEIPAGHPLTYTFDRKLQPIAQGGTLI